MIKRFSGGGTVIVDSHTIFTSFIMNAKDILYVPSYPRPIMEWTGTIYTPVFNNICHENHQVPFFSFSF